KFAEAFVPNSVCVIAAAKPNNIKAIASSIATTLKRVSVTGPFALYCLITITVAAGAVAAAIAPNIIAIERSKPASTKAIWTNNTANVASKRAITIGDQHTLLKQLILNEKTNVNAINPKATCEIIPNEAIFSTERIFNTEGPTIKPPKR